MPNQFTNPWTKPELNFLQKNIGKLTYLEMGRILDRSYPSIQSKIRFLPFQKKVKKHPLNSNFFKTWSSQMAYILGFIAADGNICLSGRAHTLHIACDDQDIIEKIKFVLQYERPIHQKLRTNGKISYSLRISDTIIFKDLQGLGITERKSLTLIPPNIPINYVPDFIRGFFDGDGSVWISKHNYPSKLRVAFYTASLAMANYLHRELKLMLSDLYPGKILDRLAHEKTPYYTLHLGHKAATKFFKHIYQNADIYMERKYKKFLEGMNNGG